MVTSNFNTLKPLYSASCFVLDSLLFGFAPVGFVCFMDCVFWFVWFLAYFFYFATAFRLVCGESYSQSGGIGWRGHTIHSRSLQTTRRLEYIKSAKRLNLRQARWALFFTHFNFAITYCPGFKKSKAWPHLHWNRTLTPSLHLYIGTSWMKSAMPSKMRRHLQSAVPCSNMCPPSFVNEL